MATIQLQFHAVANELIQLSSQWAIANDMHMAVEQFFPNYAVAEPPDREASGLLLPTDADPARCLICQQPATREEWTERWPPRYPQPRPEDRSHNYKCETHATRPADLQSFLRRPGHVMVRFQRFEPGRLDQKVGPPIAYNPLGVSVVGLLLFFVVVFVVMTGVMVAALAAGVG